MTGLQAQHLTGFQLIARIYDAKITGAEVWAIISIYSVTWSHLTSNVADPFERSYLLSKWF